MNRRDLIRTAGVGLAGTPFLTNLAFAVPTGGPVKPTISATMCNNLAASIGNSARQLHLHTATQADIIAAASTVDAAREYLDSVGWQSALIAAAARTDPSKYNPSTTGKQIAAGLNQYAPGLQPRMPSNIQAQVAQLAREGLDPTLKTLVTAIRSTAHAMPAEYHGRGYSGAEFRTVQSFGGSYCDPANTSIGLLGSAFFILTLFGCAPEPLFVVLCPAIAIINNILGFAAIGTLIFC